MDKKVRKSRIIRERKRRVAGALVLLMMFTIICPPGQAVYSVRGSVVKLRKIKLNRSSCTMRKGQKLKLKVKLAPSNTTQKKVKWKSSKTRIAKVSSKGIVTAVNAGNANITALVSGTGKKAVCRIRVLKHSDKEDEDTQE